MPHRKRDRFLNAAFSLPAMIMLIAVGLLPFFFPLAARYEGQLMPVVENAQVRELEATKKGLIINVRFDKVRACEFLGISWYDSFGDRVPVIFDLNDEDDAPYSRPVLDAQDAGPWRLDGLHQLRGSHAIVSHRCNPFWITYTHFYP